MVAFNAKDRCKVFGFKVDKTWRRGRWLLVTLPSGDQVVFYVQSPRCWHAFYCKVEATGSGNDPLTALYGRIGDVIGSDSQLRAYQRAILNAPQELLQICAGLYRESSNLYNY